MGKVTGTLNLDVFGWDYDHKVNGDDQEDVVYDIEEWLNESLEEDGNDYNDIELVIEKTDSYEFSVKVYIDYDRVANGIIIIEEM